MEGGDSKILGHFSPTFSSSVLGFTPFRTSFLRPSMKSSSGYQQQHPDSDEDENMDEDEDEDADEAAAPLSVLEIEYRSSSCSCAPPARRENQTI